MTEIGKVSPDILEILTITKKATSSVVNMCFIINQFNRNTINSYLWQFVSTVGTINHEEGKMEINKTNVIVCGSLWFTHVTYSWQMPWKPSYIQHIAVVFNWREMFNTVILYFPNYEKSTLKCKKYCTYARCIYVVYYICLPTCIYLYTYMRSRFCRHDTLVWVGTSLGCGFWWERLDKTTTMNTRYG